MKKRQVVKIYGGLGNQLFQFSFALFLKNTLKNEIYFDLNEFRYIKHHSGIELNKLLNVDFKSLNFVTHILYKLLKPILKKTNFYFEQKHSSINDYPQKSVIHSFKYFDGYWQNLDLVELIINDLRKVIKPIKLKTKITFDINAVAVHVRRGDYLSNQSMYGNICDLEFYKRAIKKLEKKDLEYHYYIFSDDYSWCYKNFEFLKTKTFVDFQNDVVDDFYLFSKFQNKIISNSTFSWWATMINKNNKLVICPKKWNNEIDYNNLIPENWIKI